MVVIYLFTSSDNLSLMMMCTKLLHLKTLANFSLVMIGDLKLLWEKIKLWWNFEVVDDVIQTLERHH